MSAVNCEPFAATLVGSMRRAKVTVTLVEDVAAAETTVGAGQARGVRSDAE